MSIYRPDYKIVKAIKLIENLDNSEESELIKYFVISQNKMIEEQNKQLKEYQDVFNMIGKFLPNTKPTVYG